MKAKISFADVPAGLPANSIVIRDIGHSEGYATITSDAEAVVETVLRVARQLAEPISRNIPPIYYYDSVDRFGQLYHDGTTFTAFSGNIKLDAANGRN